MGEEVPHLLYLPHLPHLPYPPQLLLTTRHSRCAKLRIRANQKWFVAKLLGKYSVSQEVGIDPLFLCRIMAHPLVPQIIDLATPVAENLGLEIVGAVFHTNQRPPVLRVDIRNPQQDTGLEDCERMSRALEATLDAADIIPDAYVLEVSSPGIARQLITDREFISFKGFAVIVNSSEPYEGQKEWTGQLIKRDETAVYLNQKGRAIAIPRSLITRVQLDERR